MQSKSRQKLLQWYLHCIVIVKSNKLMSKKHDIEILIMLRDDIKTLRKTFAKIFVWNKHENYDNVLCYVKYFMLNCFNHIVTICS